MSKCWVSVVGCGSQAVTAARSKLFFFHAAKASSKYRAVGGSTSSIQRNHIYNIVSQRKTISSPSATIISSERWHGTHIDPEKARKVNLIFIDKDGSRNRVEGYEGQTVLEVAHANEISIEGACEGSLACSTCHVVVDSPSIFNSLPPLSEKEEDLLDLAPGLEVTSRLSCQIRVTPALEGAVFKIPASTVNFYVDGHVPKPH